MADRRSLEAFLGMGGGYVLDFSDRTLGEFVFDAVGLDIHAGEVLRRRNLEGEEAPRILET